MELEGFNSSLDGTTVAVLVETDTDVWIPWECITGGFTVLLCGKEPRACRLLRDGMSWSLIWSPSTSREWSMLATVLKAAVQPIVVVSDLLAPVPPIAFVDFLETLPACTKVQMVQNGTTVGLLGHPTTILWANGCSMTSRMEVLRSIGSVEREETMAAAVAAAVESSVNVVVSRAEGAWKLYWIRPADSWALVKRLGETARGLLRTGITLLDL
jgi:hypothetical protein